MSDEIVVIDELAEIEALWKAQAPIPEEDVGTIAPPQVPSPPPTGNRHWRRKMAVLTRDARRSKP